MIGVFLMLLGLTCWWLASMVRTVDNLRQCDEAADDDREMS